MSSTRRSSSGEFHQERFCSSPEFEGDMINALAAAKRIAIVKDRATREILWWLQWLSLTPGALQSLCEDLIATFPERIGTPTLRRLQKSSLANRPLSASEASALKNESGFYLPVSMSAFLPDREPEPEPRYWLSTFTNRVAEKLGDLRDRLVRCCLDPQADISAGVWYFEDLLGALTILRERSMTTARSRLADTQISRKINETLDFSYARRRMVLVEGPSGIGRSETAKAWCDAHVGMVRYLEVPSSGDDRSFYSAMARALGIARGFAYNPQQIKLRVEDTLAASGLMLLLDEAQGLWPAVQRPRGVPPRMLWIKTLFDNGTPIALIALDDFSRWQELYVNKTLWTDQQFERRLNRRILFSTPEIEEKEQSETIKRIRAGSVILSAVHSEEDMLKIARANHPAGDSRSLKLLAAYALGKAKKQASGIVDVLESARHRAELDGRAEPTFADIKAALIHDQCFLSADAPSQVLQPSGSAAAEPLQRPCKRPAKQPRLTAGESDFPIHVHPQGRRITTPTVAV